MGSLLDGVVLQTIVEKLGNWVDVRDGTDRRSRADGVICCLGVLRFPASLLLGNIAKPKYGVELFTFFSESLHSWDGIAVLRSEA